MWKINEEFEKEYGYLFQPQEGKHKVPSDYLKKRQELPLNVKVYFTLNRIRQFYEMYKGKVYISNSGGKDSQVLKELVKSIYPNVLVVFVDTRMEIETREHAISQSDRVIYPKKYSYEIWKKYGLPFPSKQQANFLYKVKNTNSDYLRDRLMTGIMKDGTKTMFKLAEKWKPLLDTEFNFSDRCCYYLKKEPFLRFNKETGLVPFLGSMADEGMERKKMYMQKGCINLDKKQCMPLGFWTEQDILQFIKENNLNYCKSAYGDIIEVNGKLTTTKAKRTGCFNCLYGIHLEQQPNRLQRMKETHPTMWQSLIVGQKIGKLLDMYNIPYGKEELKQKEDGIPPTSKEVGILPKII